MKSELVRYLKASAFNWLIAIAAIVWGMDILGDGRSGGRVPGGVIDFGPYSILIGSTLAVLGFLIVVVELRRAFRRLRR